MTNLKLHTFLKNAGCPKGEEGHQIRTMTDKWGKRVKKSNIFPDVPGMSSIKSTAFC